MNNQVLFPQFRKLILPWTPTAKDKRSLNGFSFSFLAICVAMLAYSYSYEYIPPEEYEIPQSLINTIIEERELLEEKAKEAEKEAAQKEQEQEVVEEEDSAEEVEEKPKKEKKDKPIPDAENEARERASKEGLAALSSELADFGGSGLDESFGNLEDIRTIAPGVETGSEAGASGGLLALDANSAGSGSKLVTTRGAIGTGAGAALRKGSAGITSGIKDGAIGGGFGGGSGGGLAGKGGKAGSKLVGGGRTAEEIQVVFDTNKGLLDRLYQKALRVNPTLRGEVLFEITIAAQGNVLNVKVISSQLNDPTLEAKMASRIRLFQFLPKPASSGKAVIRFPINFLPSG